MDRTTADPRPVVILGAGINGAALARELVLNHVPVWLIDTADVAAGTTAYSSRLIHGGLRYLEYGELSLVRESLAERTRLLRLAPHLVQPLRLFIPISNRWGGLAASAGRFLRLTHSGASSSRGLWLVRAGLAMYDLYARDPSLPPHRIARTGDLGERQPSINAVKYPWICSYSDGQVAYPERFTLDLIADAQQLAAEQETDFRLWTYHRATLREQRLELTPVDVTRPYDDLRSDAPAATVHPRAIINASGAWVDSTLARLNVPSPQLLQGTRGTHLFTQSAALRDRLAGQAIYGEADDGRPVFILPLGSGTLVGTTDDRFQGRPEDAVATPADLQYLVQLVNAIMPAAKLTEGDVDWHYAGVRPLPRSDVHATAAVTRRHFLVENLHSPIPLWSIVGGKLTTCRSLAEEATAQILKRLEHPVIVNSRERPLPGGVDYPSPEQLPGVVAKVAGRYSLREEQVWAIWSLLGTRTDSVLKTLVDLTTETVAETPFPRAFVRWVIRYEGSRTVDDLVERRLMLLFHSPPTVPTLRDLADLLVEAGVLAASDVDAAVNRSITRLEQHFGWKKHRCLQA